MRITPPLLALTFVAAALSSPTTALAASVPAPPDDAQVLAISVDALNPTAMRKLGHGALPNLWRLVDEGAATLNARTQVEQTVTLPNHTSMVTGRRIDAAKGGHGVTWNTDRPNTTVQGAAGHSVASVFSVAHASGASTALFASKTKFSLFERSWPRGIDQVMVLEERDNALATAVRKDLLAQDRGFTFLHLGGPDKAGHASGFMGPEYRAALQTIDALIGKILHAADSQASLDDLTIILTADHGGLPGSKSHSDTTKVANYRIPFAVWGPGIEPADLYNLNTAYRDPGTKQSSLRGKQPVRNGNVANLALDLLGFEHVSGSIFGAAERLNVTATP